MKSGTFLKTFSLENFKAVQKSGTVQFTPLTVLIGNNGSGKSSLVEGLETYRSIIVDGLDTAMQRWFGMDHVWNKRARHNMIGLGLANLGLLIGRVRVRRIEEMATCCNRASP